MGSAGGCSLSVSAPAHCFPRQDWAWGLDTACKIRPEWGLEGERHHTPAKGPPNQTAVTPSPPICVSLTWGLPLDVVLSHRAAVQKILQGVCIYPLCGQFLLAGPLQENYFPCMIPSVCTA